MPKKLIFIGGPSGCGKSTFVNKLKDRYDCVTYRRLDAFKDVSLKKGHDVSEMFKYVTSSEADKQFVEFCSENECVVSDIHYALQRNKDFVSNEFDSLYVSTFSDELIQDLLNLDIEIIAIHICCSPEISYLRALERFNKGVRDMRSKNLEEVSIQHFWEKRKWEELYSKFDLRHYELDSENCTSDEMVTNFLNLLQPHKILTKTLEWKNETNNK